MSNVVNLPTFSIEELLRTLPLSQQKSINALINHYGVDKAAELWLVDYDSSNLKRFGGVSPQNKTYWYRLKSEFKLLICGHEKYNSLREKISDGPTATALVSAIATAIASSLNVSPVVIAPVIAILIHLVSSVSVNAWCSTVEDESSI